MTTPDAVRPDDGEMRYLDHEPGSWFLVEHHGELYLDARYSYSAVIDDSVLVRLEPAEREELAQYGPGEHAYLTKLARAIHNSGPYREESPFHARDLYRGPQGTAYREAVGAAIAEHTWAAEQRRKR